MSWRRRNGDFLIDTERWIELTKRTRRTYIQEEADKVGNIRPHAVFTFHSSCTERITRWKLFFSGVNCVSDGEKS